MKIKIIRDCYLDADQLTAGITIDCHPRDGEHLVRIGSAEFITEEKPVVKVKPKAD